MGVVMRRRTILRCYKIDNAQSVTGGAFASVAFSSGQTTQDNTNGWDTSNNWFT